MRKSQKTILYQYNIFQSIIKQKPLGNGYDVLKKNNGKQRNCSLKRVIKGNMKCLGASKKLMLFQYNNLIKWLKSTND